MARRRSKTQNAKACFKTSNVTAHIPDALKQQIALQARDLGVSQSAIVRAALTQTTPGQVADWCAVNLLLPETNQRHSALEPTPAKDPLGGYQGLATSVLVDDAGRLARLPAQFRLTEVSRVLTSHRPDYSANPDYPEGVQERDYYADKSEQGKIARNLRQFAPQLIFNTNPGAGDGTSICLPSGVTLSGNSRGILVEAVYGAGGKREADLRETLARVAPQFGFDARWIEGFKRPTIVRVLLNEQGVSKGRLRQLVRLFNEPMTLALDTVRQQVASASKITTADLSQLTLTGTQTMTAWLQTTEAEPFIRTLRARGVLSTADAPRYFTKTGKLNPKGRDFVAQTLAGLLIPSPDLLDQLGARLRGSLASSAGYILRADQLAADSPAWQIAPKLPAAIRLRSTVRATPGAKRAEDVRAQVSISDVHAEQITEQLANILIKRPGPRQQREGWARWEKTVSAFFKPSLFGPDIKRPLVGLERAFNLRLQFHKGG